MDISTIDTFYNKVEVILDHGEMQTSESHGHLFHELFDTVSHILRP